MSGGKACACPEKKQPVEARDWRVIQWRMNHSAFNGYKPAASDYSSVLCNKCGAIWRTKAPYADAIAARPLKP